MKPQTLGVLVIGLLLTACGSPTQRHAHAGKPHSRPHTLALYVAQGQSCVQALRRQGVRGAIFDAAGPWPSRTLAPSLKGGPVGIGRDASSIETATWNVLSESAGYPLLPYLGQNVSVVRAQPKSSSPTEAYTCLEQGLKVIGLYGHGSPQNGQPMNEVSVAGKTVSQLTGLDYLQWLETTKAYEPHPAVNSATLSAQAVLIDYFDTINAGLPTDREDAILSSLASPQMASGQGLFALVPLSITRVTDMGLSATMNPQIQAEFEVPLWPHFASIPDVAGNGLQFMFYIVSRTSQHADWMLTSAGTGP